MRAVIFFTPINFRTGHGFGAFSSGIESNEDLQSWSIYERTQTNKNKVMEWNEMNLSLAEVHSIMTAYDIYL